VRNVKSYIMPAGQSSVFNQSQLKFSEKSGITAALALLQRLGQRPMHGQRFGRDSTRVRLLVFSQATIKFFARAA
jgi:hypothetical protein